MSETIQESYDREFARAEKLEAEVERLRTRLEVAELEKLIPQEVCENLASMLGVNTHQWNGGVEKALTKLQNWNEHLTRQRNAAIEEIETLKATIIAHEAAMAEMQGLTDAGGER